MEEEKEFYFRCDLIQDTYLHQGDTYEDAKRKYDNFFGNATLSNNKGIIEQKKEATSFRDYIKSAVSVLYGRDEVIEIEGELAENYKEIFELFRNQKKGVFIVGDYGTGKTVALEVISLLSHFRKDMGIPYFKVYSSRKFVKDYAKHGFDPISAFGLNCHADWYNHGNSNIAVDELGFDNGSNKFFGNNVNVLSELIFERYEVFTKNKKTTHFTTNLLPDEIKELYGDRAYDRLKQMCQMYTWKGKSMRK